MADKVTDILCGEVRPNSRQLYLSYLQTSVLVNVVHSCEEALYLTRPRLPKARAQLMRDIRDDAILELRGRQLELFSPPKADLGSYAR
jgi:hypothetical protein